MLVTILCAFMGIQLIDRIISIIRKEKCKESTLIISVSSIIYALWFSIYSIITKSPHLFVIIILCIISFIASLWCITCVFKKIPLDIFSAIMYYMSYYFTLLAFIAITVSCSFYPVAITNDKEIVDSTISNMEVIDKEDNIYAYASLGVKDMLSITYKTAENGYNTILADKDDIKVIINTETNPNITKEQYEIIFENIFGIRSKETNYFYNKYLITVNDYAEILKGELLTSKY